MPSFGEKLDIVEHKIIFFIFQLQLTFYVVHSNSFALVPGVQHSG